MKSLKQWLESLNQNKIDLGLDRVKAVLLQPPFNALTARIITVAGTNGKGSTATALGALLQSQQQQVGVFTSPHLFHYNERIQINGRMAEDKEVVAAFEAIEAIRADISLSYFEFSLFFPFEHPSQNQVLLDSMRCQPVL